MVLVVDWRGIAGDGCVWRVVVTCCQLGINRRAVVGEAAAMSETNPELRICGTGGRSLSVGLGLLDDRAVEM